MKVLYFGSYSRGSGYPRNDVIIKGLRASGIRLSECHVDLWRGSEHKARVASRLCSFLVFLPSLVLAWSRLTLKFLRMRKDYDVMIVGYTGHIDIFLARLLNRGRPLILDAFLSLREALIEDRKMFRVGGVWDKLLIWFDRAAAGMADRVLLDTDAHIDYYCSLARLPRSKFIRVFVGEEELDFKSRMSPQLEPATVLYFGTYLPLHGVDTILRAAKRLEDEGVVIEFIGNGPEYAKIRKLRDQIAAKNVRFLTEWIDKRRIAERIAASAICLGIFGRGEKTQRVIPCKAFLALAMGKPLITADTPAAAEALSHGENAYFVPAANSQALADGIRTLLNDSQLSAKIGRGGAKIFRKNFTPAAIGSRLLMELEKLVL
jgi:glycosyltransferase involved in cell wall biosynthesis